MAFNSSVYKIRGGWKELGKHEKVILCILNSYHNRLTTNANAIYNALQLYAQAHILSPTFLMAFVFGMANETQRETKNGCKQSTIKNLYIIFVVEMPFY